MPAAKKPQEPETVSFRIDGKDFEVVDLDDLEFGEIELIEDAFGCAAEEIDFRRAKAIRWLVFISMRRAGEDVSFDDLGELKFSSIADAAPPAAETGAKKRPTKAAAGA